LRKKREKREKIGTNLEIGGAKRQRGGRKKGFFSRCFSLAGGCGRYACLIFRKSVTPLTIFPPKHPGVWQISEKKVLCNRGCGALYSGCFSLLPGMVYFLKED